MITVTVVLTVAAVVPRAAHRIPDAALSALLALETDASRYEAELLVAAFLITLADQRLLETNKHR